MIVNFSIQNFGSVKEKQTLSFEADSSTDLEKYYVATPIEGVRLLKLGLIYGANASGKTTVLKALDFLRDLVVSPEEKKTDVLDFEPFLFDSATINEASVLELEFIANGIKYLYEVMFNKTCILEESLFFYNPNKANVFKRTTDVEKQFSEVRFGSKIKNDKGFEKALIANTLWNNTVLGGYLKTNGESKELKDVTSWFSDYLRPLIYTGTKLERYVTNKVQTNEIEKANIVTILRKADFNISDVLIEEEEKDIPDGLLEFLENTQAPKEEIDKLKSKGKVTTVKLAFERILNGEHYSLPFDSESHGTKRYYGFAGILAMLLKGNVAFPVDELESSLHPDLYEHFLLTFLLNAHNAQLIATTHNREILDNRDMFRNDAVWITNKPESCSTQLYSLADFSSDVIRDTSNIYNAYKIGKLGGVPRLSDHYLNLNDE